MSAEQDDSGRGVPPEFLFSRVGREKYPLPPRLEAVVDGKVQWRASKQVNAELIGYFLCCHLAIEHYMDEVLKVKAKNLDWDAAKLSFGQRISLLSTFHISERYNCIPAIKHMNAVRNKLSHNFEFEITDEHLMPLTQYVAKSSGGALRPQGAVEVLDSFTTMVCVLFGGYISGTAEVLGPTKKAAPGLGGIK